VFFFRDARSRAKVGKAWKIAIVATSGSATAAQLLLARDATQALNLLSYYTIQSNLLVVAALLAVLVPARRNSLTEALLRASTFWIIITGTVFLFLLSSVYRPSGIAGYVNIAHHYATPLAMLVNWALFEEKGKSRSRDALLWLAYPLGFLAFSLLRGRIDGFYPYWFIDPTKAFPKGMGSYGGVAMVSAGLAAIMLSGGLAVSAMSRRLARYARRDASREGGAPHGPSSDAAAGFEKSGRASSEEEGVR